MVRASALVEFGIPGLALLVSIMMVLAWSLTGGRKVSGNRLAMGAACVAVWLTATALVGRSGVLMDFETFPPPMALMGVAIIGTSLTLGLTKIGKALASLPLWFLIGAQAFRLPLELIMHRAAVEGTMPNVMSYSGLNFDIVTGITGLALGLLLLAGVRLPTWVLYLWNTIGLLLVTTVVVIAILATPLFMMFGSEPHELNTWIFHFPYVWLPTVLVLTAFVLHIVTYRALRVQCRLA